MPLDLTMENINTHTIIGTAESQALIEGNVLLPGGAQSAGRILCVTGKMHLGTVEVQQDRVAMDGSVIFTIVHAGDDDVIGSTQSTCAFNHVLSIPGAGPQSVCRLSGELERIETTLSGGRVSLRAVAALRGQVIGRDSVPCVSAFGEEPSYEAMDLTCSFSRVTGKGQSSAIAADEFELPYGLSSTQVLLSRQKARVSSVSAQEDKVYVIGEISVDAFHTTQMSDRPIAKTSHTLPYEVEISLPGARYGDTPIVQADINDIVFKVNQPDEDSRTLKIDAVVTASAVIEEQKEVTLIGDAYATQGCGLTLNRKKLALSLGTTQVDMSDSFKTTLNLPEGSDPIGTLLCCVMRPAGHQVQSDQMGTRVDGILETTVIYLPLQSTSAQCYTEEIPFSATFDEAVPDDGSLTLTCEDAEAILVTSDRAELKAVLRLCGTYENTAQIEAIESIEPSQPIEKPQSGLTVYFANENDTLWSISKKFLAKKEDILRFNPELSSVNKGERVILYHRNSAV